MFKNETHNHPTEIEPFGGAATCLGGAIRDPLSGTRLCVPGHAPHRCRAIPSPRLPRPCPASCPSARSSLPLPPGYSSYGNQIGLATGHVAEVYRPRLCSQAYGEWALSWVLLPLNAVVREVPAPGDVVILLGGATGRDGCGGATGSSKSHTAQSLDHLRRRGAEGQRSPTERKIQRLFRNPEVIPSDPAAATTSALAAYRVAIGELADGLDIELDRVPKKYEGLDGTELAISPNPRSVWPWWLRLRTLDALHRRLPRRRTSRLPPWQW